MRVSIAKVLILFYVLYGCWCCGCSSLMVSVWVLLILVYVLYGHCRHRYHAALKCVYLHCWHPYQSMYCMGDVRDGSLGCDILGAGTCMSICIVGVLALGLSICTVYRHC